MIDIARDRFRPFIARDAKCRRDLELFLMAQDQTPVVALVDGVHALARIADLPVKSFVLFDTMTAIAGIQGAVWLDQDPSTLEPAPKRFRIDDLHAAIDAPSTPFVVSREAVKVSAQLASKITLKELFTKIMRRGGEHVTEEFVQQTCERIVGRITKTARVGRVRKKALASGMDTQLIAELERFIEDSSVSEGLWRGFYDLVESKKSMADVELQHDVRATDLEYLVSVLGGEPIGGDKYASSPLKTKKRKA